MLALACALATNAGLLIRHRGAVAAPDVDGRHPLRSARGLFASKWWTIGWIGAVVAWLLHVGALSQLQVSVVQAIISGGLVLLAVLADRFFGFALGRRQWIGLTITTVGLVALGLTGGSPSGGGRSSLGALIAVQGAVFVISLLLVGGSVRLDGLQRRQGLVLGLAAGALFGVSDISVKVLTHSAGEGPLAAVVSPWALAALTASVIAFFTSARSLQIGPGLAVIAFTSVAANVTAIGGGILVFHDTVGAGAPQIAGRVLAFCLVVTGAGMIPAPSRCHPTLEPASA
jgi:multidrug transporter EmrE-like cation transporter